MEALKNKIDFAVIVCVKNSNPNGDPLNGNRPRVNYDGAGEISDVCIKRKIRNRLMEAGKSIFVQSDDNKVDEYKNLKARIDGELKMDMKDEKKYREEVCKKWIDVRAFGQVFAFKGGSKKGKKEVEGEEEQGDDKSVSIGIRGPVSIHSAFSVSPVSITSIQITKSVSGEGDGTKKSSDTMGMKHRVDHGVYIIYGSMNPQLASKTGFSDEDAEAIKQALINLFQNDVSSARPEGSMEVHKVYWWKHNSNNGQYSSATVHRSLEVSLKPDVTEPKDIKDYNIKIQPLADLKPEELDGN
jgi:CRISPR-associated protein Csd2